MQHLVLPVLDESGAQRVSQEILEVEPLTDRTVRLLHSPAFVEGIAGGDVIEPAEELLQGFRVITRAGNLAVVVAFQTDDQKAAQAPGLAREVSELGGVFEGGPHRVGVFTIPLTSGFSRIEGFFDSRCATEGMAWWFGNVYEPEGELLDWLK